MVVERERVQALFGKHWDELSKDEIAVGDGRLTRFDLHSKYVMYGVEQGYID